MKKQETKKTRKIIPLGDRVLIKPLSVDELSKTSSGIIIPDTVSKEKPEHGIVVAIGDGLMKDGKRIPISLNISDTVIFSRYGYDEIKLDGEEFYILKEENILAIIK